MSIMWQKKNMKELGRSRLYQNPRRNREQWAFRRQPLSWRRISASSEAEMASQRTLGTALYPFAQSLNDRFMTFRYIVLDKSQRDARPSF